MPSATHIPPIHPGEILREEFMEPLGLKAYTLAKHLSLPRNTIESIVRETVGISADTALRLARFFKTTPGFWLNAQKHFELETAKDRIGNHLNEITPLETVG